MTARILLVEDNEELAAGIRHNLELEGFHVSWAADGPAGLAEALSEPPDLLILDVMLPGLDGFQVLKALRAKGFKKPVLVLTARGEEADKVRGFRLDADQYVTKPFGLLEFLERVRSLLRRDEESDLEIGSTYAFGDVLIDTRGRSIRRGDSEIAITPRAFDLLVTLVKSEGQVLSRHELLRRVWGHRAEIVTRTVDSHISELRQKLELDPSSPRHIHTVWKIGYRFDP